MDDYQLNEDALRDKLRAIREGKEFSKDSLPELNQDAKPKLPPGAFSNSVKNFKGKTKTKKTSTFKPFTTGIF